MAYRIIFAICIAAVTACAQSSSTTVKNFDTVLSQNNADIVIQPPAGKTWVLLRGSFVIQDALPDSEVTVFEQGAEGPEFRTNLIQADLATHRWISIIGGYAESKQFGNSIATINPIELPYPFRLIIHVTNLKHPQTVQSFTRFTVLERPSVR